MNPLRNDATTPRPKTPLKIIVADDVPDLLALLVLWLEEAGHAVTRASGGHEIVELIRESPFDLVITDIIMTDGDGWNAIAEVHKLRPATRILAMSGGLREMPASAVLRVAQGAGAIGVIKKPFSRVDLLAEIARVIATPSEGPKVA